MYDPRVLILSRKRDQINKSRQAEAAFQFVRDRGYDEATSRGIVESLENPSSGISRGGLLPFVTTLAGRWEVGDDDGLAALALAVSRELAERGDRKRVSVVVRPPRWPSASAFSVVGWEGASLKDATEGASLEGGDVLAEYLECACSGVMACSTCQVYVDDAWFAKVGAPSEAEQDMLDLAADPRPNSRLACQIVLSPELDGLTLTIPASANNLFDDLPF